MPTATIPNGGTYDLEVDIGFSPDAFTLDSSTRGVLDDPDFVLDGTTAFASITNYVLNVAINRGRKDPEDQFGAGTMSFTLNDTGADGVFSPFDNDSPYFDDITNYPGLAPGREIRFSRYDASNVKQTLFVGRIVNYNYDFQLGGLDTVNVYCADQTYWLASTYLTAHNPTKEFTGARVAAILDRAEVNYPTGAARNISAGTVELGGGGSYSIAEGTNVKAYFDDITYSAERGRIFVDREGVLVSQDRIGNTLSAPVVTFSDDLAQPTQARYNRLGITFKAEDIVNRVAVTPAGGTQQVAEDLASQAEFLVKALYLDGSLLHDNSAALTLADYLLFPEAEPRFDSLETFFGSLTATLRDACATLDVGDTVIITKRIPVNGVPTDRSEELALEGVSHRVTFDRGHTVQIYTSPTVIVYPLILDDAMFGILDTNAVA
jgi:hypothetical protein